MAISAHAQFPCLNFSILVTCPIFGPFFPFACDFPIEEWGIAGNQRELYQESTASLNPTPPLI
jgi:hypothetical protein